MAFLAGLGTGYIGQRQKELENDRAAAKDQREKDLFDANMTDRNQALADKNALRTAAAPVAVTEAAGQPMPAEADNSAGVASDNPTVGGYKAGANTFAARGLATADAAAQNTPDGARSRVMAALAAQGNVLGADQLATSGIQTQAAKVTLDKGKREEAQAVFTQGLHKAIPQGPEAIAKFMSDSSADGTGGATKFAAVMNPDSTWQMMRIGPDGVQVPFGGKYTNDTNGYIQAGYDLDASVKPEAKVAHMMAEKEFALKQEKETSESSFRTSHGKYFESMAGKADSWEPGGGKSPVDRMSEIDKTTLLNINKERDTVHNTIVKALAEDNFDLSKPGPQALQTKLKELTLKSNQIIARYSGQSSAPDPAELRKPAVGAPGKLSASELSLRPKLIGDMGADPKAILREIAATTSDLQKVTDPDSKAQLQSHLDDMQRQYANLSGTTKAPALATTPQTIAAGGVAAQPTVTAPAAAPSAPALAAQGVRPQPPANPVEAAGVQVDQARSQLSALLSSPRPGLAAGRAAIDAYAAKVAMAKQMVEQAEAAYQSVLPRQGAAFMAQRRIAVP